MLRQEMNMVNDENLRTKTRNQILSEQLKAKDRFIDELLKSTQALSE